MPIRTGITRLRVAAIIEGLLCKIIDSGSRCGSIVPFPFSGWGTERSPLTVNGDLANHEGCG